MSERSVSLAQRRSALRTHCTIQRAELARQVAQVEARLGPVDRGINIFRYYASQPLLIGGAIALFTALGPKRLVRWISRGAVFFTAGRRVMRFLR
ncbi:MAG TPA: YqjK family protein [Povalibacter sp.]